MIKLVKAENFLSWKELDFTVNPGVTLIDGWNDDDQTPEGSGKSAILNAISWCLYGKLPKDAKIDDVIKRGEKGCRVLVELNDCRIIRCRKPNDLLIMLPDGSEQRGKDAKDTQKMIEDKVGLSFDTFCQTIYFAQNYNKKFVTATQEEKGKILSEVQDLRKFDTARQRTMYYIKEQEKELTETVHQAQLLERDEVLTGKQLEYERDKISALQKSYQDTLNTAQASADQARTLLEKTINDHKRLSEVLGALVVDTDRLEQAQYLRGEYEGQIFALRRDLGDIDSAKKHRRRKEQELTHVKARLELLAKQYQLNEDFIKNPSQECPTCKTTLKDLDTSHARKECERILAECEELKKNKNELETELVAPEPDETNLVNQLKIIKENLKTQEQIIAQIADTRSKQQKGAFKLESMAREAENYKLQVDRETLRLQQIQSNPPQVDHTLIEQLETKKKQIFEQKLGLIQKSKEQEDRLQRLKTLKDGFKEIKSFLFNSMLNEINSKIQGYLSELFEVPIQVSLVNDNMKIETQITYDGDERGLGLLSGGQFRRVSLAVDLALSEVITARKGSVLGVLILDEYFKDLSETSMEKCLNLLEGRGQPVLLIEHNSIFKNIVTNTYKVRLQEGTSSVEV